jgi:hypothetical protein
MSDSGLIMTGEEPLHGGLGSSDNLSGVLLITVTKFIGKLLFIPKKHLSKMAIFIFKNSVFGAILNFDD